MVINITYFYNFNYYYIIFPFSIFLIKLLSKLFLSDIIVIHIKQKNKFISVILSLICCSVFLFFGGWAINHHWLPDKFHPISLLGNILILLFTLFLGYILIKINLLKIFKIINKNYIKIVKYKHIPKFAFYLLICMVIFNLYVLIDGKINPPNGPHIILF